MKVLLRTYGCRANQYDTEALRAALVTAGVEETENPAEAEFAVFNSCTVTASAEADLRSGIRYVARANPSIQTVVMGCAAGIPGRDERTAPLATLPGVTAIVPGADITAVSAAIGLQAVNGAAAPNLAQTTARAHLRIQDGCDEHCTFCATTLARGASRSRLVPDLVAEAQMLALSHPEIVVTGIHIGTYGRDIGVTLGELMEQLVEAVPEGRFRLTSIEATEVDDRLARLLTSDSARIAPHLHAPLQSGSDRVLRRMGRTWYDAERYESAVLRLVEGREVFGLSADVIAGFPGETETDHTMSMRLVERLPFTSLHVFPFSPRPGTAATRLGGSIDGNTARRRARELRELASSKAQLYMSRRIGGNCDVVVTERGKGITEDYLSVTIPDVTIPRRARFPGVIRDVDGNLTVLHA